MKKTGIRLLLSLVLLTTLVLAATVPVSAKGKPVKLGIEITDISDGSITVSYWWDKIGAHYYLIGIHNSTGQALNYTEVYLGGRTPSQSGNVTFTNSQITCGQTYSTHIWLERRGYRAIRGAEAYDEEFFECPVSCIFYEDFTGVATLPAGWVTNNASIVYVYSDDQAGGSVPELLLWYGEPESATQDYWARTPSIDASNTTTTLGLTFKHVLWTWDWANNFTYSVEVSNDGGSNWTAVLEGTVAEDPYPEPVFGPETANIDLSAYVGDTILVRWRLRGYTFYSDGWFIDDICVHGY